MKIVAKYVERLRTDDNKSKITLLVENFQHQRFIDDLSTEKVYAIEIKEIKSKRSIQQNKLLWSLLHSLEVKTRELAIDWYVKALTDTGALVDYIWVAERIEDAIKKSFRALIRVQYEKRKKVDGHWCRVIVGSSKFNVAEMNELLDTVLRYCAEEGIETDLLDY